MSDVWYLAVPVIAYLWGRHDGKRAFARSAQDTLGRFFGSMK